MSIYEPPFEMKADPPVGDGCAECGGPRVTTRNRAIDGTQVPNTIWLSHVERDPFCTSECARAWHGFPLDETRLAA